MLKLKQRFKFRVTDRLAVAAALVLTVTALGGVVSEQVSGQSEPAPAQLLKARQVETETDDVVERHSAKARLLLFRRG